MRPDDPVTHHELGLAYQGKNKIAVLCGNTVKPFLSTPGPPSTGRDLAALQIDGQ